MSIHAKVTNVIADGEHLLATVETTNTDFPSVTKTFTLSEPSTQSLSGYKLVIDRAVKLIWIGHSQPSWIVDVDSIPN